MRAMAAGVGAASRLCGAVRGSEGGRTAVTAAAAAATGWRRLLGCTGLSPTAPVACAGPLSIDASPWAAAASKASLPSPASAALCSAPSTSPLRWSRGSSLQSAAPLPRAGAAVRGCAVGACVGVWVSSPTLGVGRRHVHQPVRVRGVGPRPDQPSRRQRALQSARRRLQLSARLAPHLPLHSPVHPSPPPLLSLPPQALSHDRVPYAPTVVPSSLPVWDLSSGAETGLSVPLPPFLFSAPLRTDVLHRVVEWQRAGARQGTAKTKDRGEVSGTGKKPHPQKGTGRARQGTRRAPHHRGGGVAHGKTPRSFAFKLNKKVRALGLRVALTVKHAQGRLRIVQHAAASSHKTRSLRAALSLMGVKEFLLVHGEGELDDNLALAARNLPHCDFLPSRGANVLSLMRHPTLLLTTQAMRELQDRLRTTMQRHSRVINLSDSPHALLQPDEEVKAIEAPSQP